MKIKVVCSLVAFPVLLGCAAGDEVMIERVENTQTYAISTTAGDNVVLQSETPSGSRICTVHTPSVAESFNDGVSLFGRSAQSGDSVIELTGRSPVLSIQQNTFSALCAMYLSGAVNNEDYVRLMTRYTDKYAEALTEQVKQTTITLTQGNGPDAPPAITLPPTGFQGGSSYGAGAVPSTTVGQ